MRRLALLTALALHLCWLIARPFVASLAWASALAVAAWPLHRWLARALRRPGLAAQLTCTLVLIVIGAPATMLVPRILAESAGAFETLRGWIDSGGARQLLERQAWMRPAWDWTQGHLNTGALRQRAVDLAAGLGKTAVRASLDGLLQLALGGLFVFGMAGLFVGPVVLATTLALLRIWTRRSRASARAALSPPASPRTASAAPPR